MTASIERASPLAQWSQAFARVSASPANFTIREVPFTTQVDLRGDASDDRFCAAVRTVFGFDLPAAANTFTGDARTAAIWLGPDEWLVTAGEGGNEELAGRLRRALEAMRHAVTDVSAARTVIEVAGEDARLVLAKGCPLDLHARSFAPPQSAATLLAKARVVIQCMDPRPTFRLFVLNSFAAYLAEWLVDAAAECAAARDIDTTRVAARLA